MAMGLAKKSESANVIASGQNRSFLRKLGFAVHAVFWWSWDGTA
jgi:hypothetical protein